MSAEPDADTRQRYTQVSARARRLLDAGGESGRFEFKRDAKAVKAEVLVAAANWAALNPDKQKVTLLVGVDEHADPETGVVTGKVVGLKDLHKDSETIQNYVRDTHPAPVDVRIVEEGTATSTPFLRLEIAPTLPPHYDNAGRRVIRNNASTRPLVDDELLAIYLDREGARFEQRFAQTANHLLAGIYDIASTVDDVAGTIGAVVEAMEGEVSDQLDALRASAWEAASDAEDSKSVAERIEYDLQQLGYRLDNRPQDVFFKLRDQRQLVWFRFAHNAALRPTKATPRQQAELKALLETPIDPHDWLGNDTEYYLWRHVLRDLDKRSSMAGWTRAIELRRNMEPIGAVPVDEGLIERLREELDELQGDGKPRGTNLR